MLQEVKDITIKPNSLKIELTESILVENLDDEGQV